MYFVTFLVLFSSHCEREGMSTYLTCLDVVMFLLEPLVCLLRMIVAFQVITTYIFMVSSWVSEPATSFLLT